MTADSTSANSGETTRSLSSSVFEGMICSSGTISPVDGQAVLDQAVMADLQQFLDPAAGEAKDFHGGPGPERVVVFVAEVAALAGGRVVGPDLVGGLGDRAGSASGPRR